MKRPQARPPIANGEYGPVPAHPLLMEAARHTRLARAIIDKFEGEPMPANVVRLLDEHLAKASELRQQAAEWEQERLASPPLDYDALRKGLAEDYAAYAAQHPVRAKALRRRHLDPADGYVPTAEIQDAAWRELDAWQARADKLAALADTRELKASEQRGLTRARAMAGEFAELLDDLEPVYTLTPEQRFPS